MEFPEGECRGSIKEKTDRTLPIIRHIQTGYDIEQRTIIQKKGQEQDIAISNKRGD